MGWQPGRSRSRDLRIGTPERERALALLGEHVGAGRLDLDEYEQRCTRVTTARYESELAAVFSDLPEPLPERSSPVRAPARPPSATIVLWSAVAIAIVVLAVATKQALLLVLLLLGIAVLYRRHR